MGVDDQYSKLLLHCNGADGSTTIRDEAGKTVTPAGNAQIDTAQFKFGEASLLLDGTGDYLSIPDSDDWRLDDGSNSNQWTIDLWVRWAVDPGTSAQQFLSQAVDGDNWWVFGFYNNNLQFQVEVANSVIILIQNGFNPVANTWYHCACVKQGTTGYKMFVNGTQIGSTQTDTDVMPALAAPLQIGYRNGYFNGWMDEIRVSKGIARWTTNFTPPDAEYKSGFKPKIIMM